MRNFLYDKYATFLTWFGDLYFATTPPKTDAKAILGCLNRLRDGQIVLRGYNYYLDSHFIPGEYTHSGIIDGTHVYHMVAEGIRRDHIIDFIKDTDRFCLVRPWGISKSEIKDLLRAAKIHKDSLTKYDFLFSDPGKFYCHEYTADCLQNAHIRSSTGFRKPLWKRDFPVIKSLWERVKPVKKSFGIWPFKFDKTLYLGESFLNYEIVFEFK